MLDWSKIIDFHKMISMKADANQYILASNDHDSDSQSFFSCSQLINDQILKCCDFNNPDVLSKIVGKELYIGGCLWTFHKRIDNTVKKVCSPLLLRHYSIEINDDDNEIILSPQMANWIVSPFFISFLNDNNIWLANDIDIDTEVEKIINGYNEKTEEKFTAYFWDCLFSVFPSLKDTIKSFNQDWVLFSTSDDFGLIQKRLIEDYCKLSLKIRDNPDDIGCLKYFTDMPEYISRPVDIRQFIPLNDNQFSAVERVISGAPVSAISGPPGCGKSQVVISIMLNAWRNNQSVLFASTNNKAVDVVFDRFQEYERGTLHVIRAGSNANAKLVNRLSLIKQEIGHGLGALLPKPMGFVKTNNLLQVFSRCLDSNIPKQIDELINKAIVDSVESENYSTKIISEKNDVKVFIKETLSVDIDYDEYHLTLKSPFAEWKKQYEKLCFALENNHNHVSALDCEITIKEELANKLLSKYYTATLDVWKTMIEDCKLFVEWFHKFQPFILHTDTSFLSNIAILPDYAAWNSEAECENIISTARELLCSLDKFESEKLLVAINIDSTKKTYLNALLELQNKKLSTIDENQAQALNDWKSIYSEYLLRKPQKLSSLPFSKFKRLNKTLRKIEYSLLDVFGADKLQQYQSDDERHMFVYQNLSVLIDYFTSFQAYENINEERQVIDKLQNDFNNILSIIGAVPELSLYDKDKISEVKKNVSDILKKATMAQTVYQNIKQKSELLDEVSIGRGHVNKITVDTIDSGILQNIKNALNTFLLSPTESNANLLRLSVLNEEMPDFCKTIGQLSGILDEIQDLKNARNQIPLDEVLQKNWMDACPEALKPIFDIYVYSSYVSKLSTVDHSMIEISAKYDESFKNIAEYTEKKHGFYDSALKTIREGLELCKKHEADYLQIVNVSVSYIDDIIKEIENNQWDYNHIRAVSKYNELQNEKHHCELIVQKYLLDEALNSKQKYLSEKENIKTSISLLINDYNDNRNAITENGEKVFKDVLQAAPLWITTDHSPQSIPMEPGIFDILVIDEATQCTITSVLPLLYRCKRIVVIGDEKQLPAINDVSKYAESMIANECDIIKDGVYEFLISKELNNVGCNIYRTVLDNCACKETMLVEHYRCHPQIIAFSNYYIYQKRLLLNHGKNMLPAYGVYGINVHGFAQKEGKSWYNVKEAERVALAVKNAQMNNHGKSIGVITPFRRQAEIIEEIMKKTGDIINVHVSTVHDYQGDERDIIIFSPVVADGMGASTIRWVEEPENLINVAVTRAKDMLCVVADFDTCGLCPGILGKLIKYVNDVNLLRETSVYEVKLFSLLAMQNWKVEVHKRIEDIEVDFVINNVVIEVDGNEFHKKTKTNDKQRDAMLCAHNYKVLRFTPSDIDNIPTTVMERIKEAL